MSTAITLEASTERASPATSGRLFERPLVVPARPKRALFVFHGGHEHSGRMIELAERIAWPGLAVFSWDARGHGRSPGRRGHAEHFHELVADADAIIRATCKRHGIALEDAAVLGHSMGSVVAATWLHDYAPPIRAAVFGSPAFDVKLYVPFADAGLRLLERIAPDARVRSYVTPSMLTSDPDEIRAREADPLIHPHVSVRVLTSLRSTAKRVIDGAPSVKVPILVLSAGRDRVVHRRAHERYVDRLGTDYKSHRVYWDLRHELFHEKEREKPIEDARAFLREAFDQPRPIESTAPAGEAEHAALSRPLPWYHPKRFLYALVALFLATIGRLSRGIRVGREHGFDSGPMLDYVYENRARGVTPLGRVIDRVYLESAGWRGIRERRKHLTDLIVRAVRKIRRDAPSREHGALVLDVASGPGRYVLDALETLGDPKVAAVCRDRDEAGLALGRRLAAAREIENVRYEVGDAFAAPNRIRWGEGAEPLREEQRKPDVIVVSGLFELFHDNDAVASSLAHFHAALADGGVLVYTNQPYHPQLELIARTLRNHRGKPWVMRPRPQAEMNALVRRAGFDPEEMRIDRAGIFSVTLASKR
jgi:alpha-beta hydrolase superfamily lysophospholipase/SAM-dependent methyltransferase